MATADLIGSSPRFRALLNEVAFWGAVIDAWRLVSEPPKGVLPGTVISVFRGPSIVGCK